MWVASAYTDLWFGKAPRIESRADTSVSVGACVVALAPTVARAPWSTSGRAGPRAASLQAARSASAAAGARPVTGARGGRREDCIRASASGLGRGRAARQTDAR